MSKLYSFNRDTAIRIAEQANRESAKTRNAIGQGLRRNSQSRRRSPDVLTGTTRAKPGDTYPTSGCTVPVQIEDWEWLEQEGCTWDAERPHDWRFVWARAISEQLIPAETKVHILRVSTGLGPRWYVIEGGGGGGLKIATITEVGGIGGGSKGEVTQKCEGAGGGATYQAWNLSEVLFEQGMQVFTFVADCYSDEVAYPYDFAICEDLGPPPGDIVEIV